MQTQCKKCSYGGPEGEAHYHITVKNGKVVEVWYVSASGCHDYEIPLDECFIEYEPCKEV